MDFLLQNLAVFLGLIILAHFSWRKIEHGIYLIIFFLPAYLLRIEIFGIPTTMLELGIYLLFVVWLTKISSWQSWRRNICEWLKNNKLLWVGIFLLMAGATISTIFSIDLKTSAGILKGWFFDPFLFFIVLVSVIKTLEQKENVLKSFFASAFAVAGISLVYWLAPQLSGVSYDGRLRGFYLSPNYLSMYLAPALIIGIYGILISISKTKRGTLTKYGWRSGSAIIAFAIYLTYSYAAWFAIVIAVFLMLYFALRRQKRILFLILTLLFSASLVFDQLGTNKFEGLKNLSYRSSLNSRLMIWRSAWLIGKDHPVIGIGPGNFQKYYLDYQSRVLGTEPYLEWAVPQPHNIFLAFWLQTGIIGLAGFILLIFWFFRTARLSIFLFPLMIYLIIHGFFDTPYWKNDLSMIFWIVLGLAVVLHSKNIFHKSSTGY